MRSSAWARTDPALAGEGAVLLLEQITPAVSDIDSSSGALGNATVGVVEKMVPLIATASVPRRVREKWLERLLEAIQEDDPDDLAIRLAQCAPVDPKTLVRAARDHVKSQPAFALEAALTALHWMASGVGYELAGTEVCSARDHALAAAETLGLGAVASARIAEHVTGHGASARWVRQCLGLDAA